MGLPMIPSPMNAIVLTSLLDSVRVVGVSQRPARDARCSRGNQSNVS